jgi:hypothetical protein
MGYFSWACKGCGHDLKEGELVRMNGCRGLYDGYGGNSGGFSHDNCHDHPACWHERCYKRANTAERDDETPSDDASFQGFGYPALEFLKGYDENAETSYTVRVSHRTGTYPDTKRHDLRIVREGEELVLSDYDSYLEAWDNWDHGEEFPENYFEMTDEDKDARQKRLKERFESETGLKDPELNEVSFASMDEARAAVDLLLDMPEYHLVILGTQGEIQGQCYERERRMKYSRAGDELRPAGEYLEEVRYERGVPNKNQKHRLSAILFGD